MRLEFSASAVQDLIRLRDFIAVHNPAAARISLHLRQAIGKLVTYPDMGRPVPELTKISIAGRYIIVFGFVASTPKEVASSSANTALTAAMS